MNQNRNCDKTKFRDKYIIIADDIYGEGCFGQTYTCKKIDDSQNDIKYCVKIIPINIDKEMSRENEEIIKSTIAQLENNQDQQINIVKIHEIYFDTHVLYIVMEKCEEDLSIEFDKMIEENTWYTEEEVFDIIQQIIKGIQYLYKLKIQHVNIKPENILIKYVDEVKIYKISDYKITNLILKLTKKQDLIRAGSPNYSAPEVFEIDMKQSIESDIFSFGVLFYQICYKAQLPYDCSSMQKRYQSLQYLKNNQFKAPPLNYSKGKILQNLLESMIVYHKNKRIPFTQLFNHAVMDLARMGETQLMHNSSKFFKNSTIFDKSINFEKKKKSLLFQRLQRLQLLLQSFLDKFYVCQQLIQQIEENDDYLFFKLNIYLIGNYQLLYALALINVIPQEIHPCILKYNDQLMLIEKLQEVQQGIEKYKTETQMYQDLSNQIQSEYHKFANQFKRFQHDIYLRNGLTKEQNQFLNQALMTRIQFTILLQNIKNFQQTQTYLNRFPKNLYYFLDQVLQFGSLSPNSLYQKDTDQQFQQSQQFGKIG